MRLLAPVLLGLPLAAAASVPPQASSAAFQYRTPLEALAVGSNLPHHANAEAGRTRGRIVAGQASIQRGANTIVINQGSPQLTMDWQRFGVDDGEAIVIHQPGASALLVIRVTGSIGSRILGRIVANGRVRLVNANGIVFGKTAHVQAGELVATTQRIDDAQSTAIVLPTVPFDRAPRGDIVNRGTLTAAAGGSIALLGTHVANHGSIHAPGGTVRLIGDHGNTTSSGHIDVSGTHGGSVQLLSDRDVGVTRGSIDASGRDAGGSIRIGGGCQGGEDLLLAERTYVSADVVLNVDATERGNGGSLVLCSEHATASVGALFARGGARGGDGGLVETSSHGGLSVTRAADASAAHGQAGLWLLDPNDIEIVASGTDDNIIGSTSFHSTDDDSKLTVGTLKTALSEGTDVMVRTEAAGADSQDGNITLTADLDYDGIGSGGTLTLEADNNIILNGLISDGDTGSTDSLGLVLNAPGNIILANNITTSGGAVTFNGDVVVSAGSVSIDTTGGGASAAGADINLANAVDGSTIGANALNLQAGTAGNIVFGGTVGDNVALDSLHVTSANIAFSGGVVTTTQTQVYDSPVGLINPTTLSGVGITFNKAVYTYGSSLISLTIHGGSGAVDFNADAGGAYLLGALAIDGSGATSLQAVKAESLSTGTGTLTMGGNITTIASQTYNGAVLLDADIVLNTGNSPVHFKGTVDNAINGTPEALTVKADGASVGFDAAVGGSRGALGALTLVGSGTASLAAVTASSLDTGSGTITLHGDIGTSGDQNYNSAVLLDDSAGDNSLSLSGNTVTFTSTLDNAASLGDAQALSVDVGAAGAATFGGKVGSVNGALGALALAAGGSAEFDNTVQAASLVADLDAHVHADVTTHGVQTWNGTLYQFYSMTLASNGGAITLADVSNEGVPASLSPDADTGSVAFNGDVCASGCTSPLGLDVTAAGGITQGAGSELHVVAYAFDAGTAAISLAGNNQFGGSVDLTGGTTRITNAGALSLGALATGDLTVTSTGALNLGSGTVAGTLDATSNNGAITQAGALSVAGSGSSTLDAGTGNITLATAGNNFAGTVNLSGASAQLVDVDALALGNVLAGNLGVSSGGALNLGTGTIAGTLSATSASGGINQNGALTVAGTATLAATGGAVSLADGGNDFHGDVTASGDDVSLTDTNDLVVASLTGTHNGNVDLTANGHLGLDADVDAGIGNIALEAGDMLLDHALTGAAIDLTANGTIAATGSITGNTTVHAGTLQPGTDGTGGSITGNYTQLPGATLFLAIGATGSHKLAVSGNASLAGTLEVLFSNSPGAGDEFTVVTAASRSGTFGNLTAIGLGNRLAATTAYDDGSATVKVEDAVPDLAISIDDSQTYVKYGKLLNYVVTVDNDGTTDADNISVDNAFPASQLDANSTTWICLPGSSSVTCVAAGSGPLTDTGVVIPAGKRATWVVSAPVRSDAPGNTLLNQVTVTDVDAHSADDSDVLVIFRDEFEGVAGRSTAAATAGPATALACAQDLGTGQTLVFSVPDTPTTRTVEAFARAQSSAGGGFRIERTTLGGSTRVRLVGVAAGGREQASAWSLATPGAPLAIGTARGDEGSVVLLEGAARSLSLPLPAGAVAGFRVHAARTCDVQ